MLPVLLTHLGLLLAFVGLVAMTRPVRRLGLGTRGRGAAVAIAGTLLAITAAPAVRALLAHHLSGERAHPAHVAPRHPASGRAHGGVGWRRTAAMTAWAWRQRMWRNNNLSIVLVILFLLSLVGHAVSGWLAHNAEQRQHGEPAISLTTFVGSSEFGETVFENWESEFLQMAFYVLLTVFLYQKGSAESKKHDGNDEVEEDPLAHQDDPDVPAPVRAGGWRLTLYKNSLSLALAALFLVSFIGHAAAGAGKHAEELRQHGEAGDVTVLSYMQTPQFWYESFQNWQSEFLAVLAIVVLSIRLRQWGSPESKPVHAPHSQTGSG